MSGETMLTRLLGAAEEGLEPNFTRWARFLDSAPDEPLELQALRCTKNIKGQWDANQVAHAFGVQQAVALLEQMDRFEPVGLFTVSNRIDPAVATRAAPGQWHVQKKGESTTDSDIIARRVAYLDLDPKRPTMTSSTIEQLKRSLDLGHRLFKDLAEILGGFDSLGVGMSGNGGAVAIALGHLPSVPATSALVAALLEAANDLYSTHEAPVVKVDLTLKDAKRLMPAFGTIKRKGAPGIEARPHRRSAWLCAEKVRRVDTVELASLVEKLRGRCSDEGKAAVDKALGKRPEKAPQPSGPTSTRPRPSSAQGGDLTPFGRANLVPIEDVLLWLDLLTEGNQPECPGCGSSDAGVAIIKNGLKCSHDRCAAKGVRSGFRTVVDVVAEGMNISPVQAVNELASRYDFQGFPEPNGPKTTRGEAPPSRAAPTGEEFEEPDFKSDGPPSEEVARSVPPPRSQPEPAVVVPAGVPWRTLIDYKVDARSGDTEVRATMRNTALILAHDEAWKGVLSYDAFAQQVMLTAPPPRIGWAASAETWKACPMTETDYTQAEIWLDEKYKIRVPGDPLYRAIAHVVSKRRTFHPVRDYLDSLVWDGTERLRTGARVYFGSPDVSGIESKFFRWFMMSSVARIDSPGIKVDTMLILEGPQGRGKSQAVRVLANPWYTDTTFKIGNKDAFISIQGKWIVEVAELEGILKSDDEGAKAFLSSGTDRFRSPYGRFAEDYPRQTTFFGTVNKYEYLRDPSGGRRYMPILCRIIDLAALDRDRDQLWAEAVFLVRNATVQMPDGTKVKEKFWAETDEEVDRMQKAQELRFTADVWEEKVKSYLLDDRNAVDTEGVMPSEVLEHLGMAAKDQEPGKQNRVQKILERLGLQPGRPRRRNGSRPRAYVFEGQWPPAWGRTDDEAAE